MQHDAVFRRGLERVGVTVGTDEGSQPNVLAPDLMDQITKNAERGDDLKLCARWRRSTIRRRRIVRSASRERQKQGQDKQEVEVGSHGHLSSRC